MKQTFTTKVDQRVDKGQCVLLDELLKFKSIRTNPSVYVRALSDGEPGDAVAFETDVRPFHKAQGTLEVRAKCSDAFVAIYDGKTYQGYIPRWMPEEYFGYQVHLKIDLETGTILNWKQPLQSEVDATFEQNTLD